MDDASVLLLLDEMRKFSDHICDRIDAVGNRLKRIEEFSAKREKQLTFPSAPAPSPSPTSTTAASQAAAASAAAPGEAVFASSGSEHTAVFGSTTTETPLHHPPARCSTLGLTHGKSTLVPVSTAPAPPSTLPAALSASASTRPQRPPRPRCPGAHLRAPRLRRPRRAPPRAPRPRRPRRASLRVLRLRRPRRAPPRPPRPRCPRRAPLRRPWCRSPRPPRRAPPCPPRPRRARRAPPRPPWLHRLPWLHQPQLTIRSVRLDCTALQELSPMHPAAGQAVAAELSAGTLVIFPCSARVEPSPPTCITTSSASAIQCMRAMTSLASVRAEGLGDFRVPILAGVVFTTELTSCATFCLYHESNKGYSFENVQHQRYIAKSTSAYSVCVVLPWWATRVLEVATSQSIVLLDPLLPRGFDKEQWPPPLFACKTLLIGNIQGGLCFCSLVGFCSATAQRKPPWPPPLIQFEVTDGVVQLRAVPWPSFWECAIELHCVNLLPMVFVDSATTVQVLGFCEKIWPLNQEFIFKCSDQCLQFFLQDINFSNSCDCIPSHPTISTYTDVYWLFVSFQHKPVQWKLSFVSLMCLYRSSGCFVSTTDIWLNGILVRMAGNDLAGAKMPFTNPVLLQCFSCGGQAMLLWLDSECGSDFIYMHIPVIRILLSELHILTVRQIALYLVNKSLGSCHQTPSESDTLLHVSTMSRYFGGDYLQVFGKVSSSKMLLVLVLSSKQWYCCLCWKPPWPPLVGQSHKWRFTELAMFWLLVCFSWATTQQRSPWPPPIQLQTQSTDIQLRPIPWPSFSFYTVGVQWKVLLPVVFCCPDNDCSTKPFHCELSSDCWTHCLESPGQSHWVKLFCEYIVKHLLEYISGGCLQYCLDSYGTDSTIQEKQCWICYEEILSSTLIQCYEWDVKYLELSESCDGEAGINSGQWMIVMILHEFLQFKYYWFAHHWPSPDTQILASPIAQFKSGNNLLMEAQLSMNIGQVTGRIYQWLTAESMFRSKELLLLGASVVVTKIEVQATDKLYPSPIAEIFVRSQAVMLATFFLEIKTNYRNDIKYLQALWDPG